MARPAQAALLGGFAAASWLVTWFLHVGPGLEGAVALALVFTLAGLTAWLVAAGERTPARFGLMVVRMFLAAVGFMDVALTAVREA